MVKNLPANAGGIREGIQSLGGENPLEEGMTTHSSILAWTISWTEEPGGLQSIGLQELDTTEGLSMHACLNSTFPFFFFQVRLAQRS